MSARIINGRNPGDNITIMNTMFTRGVDPDTNKYTGFLTLVYKDCDTGVKYKEELVNPDYEYYIADEDHRVQYQRLFIPKKDAVLHRVPYMELEKDIAKNLGMSDYFFENIRNGNRAENKKIHLHPDVFNSDMNIEDHYRYRFNKLYKNEPCPVTKSFFDIEADVIDIAGDFPEPGEAPINAVSLILQEQKQVYTFLLRNKKNPQIEEFEKECNSGKIIPELKQFVIDSVTPDLAKKYHIDFEYAFLFYDEEDEINLIKDLFSAFNNYKPDFALAWNMSFDLNYIIERIKKLGYDPKDIVCHPDFEFKHAEYFVDERMKNEPAERGDHALISSYTTFLDQMVHFASRRKGQSKFLSFSLDFIGEAIAKVRKLDYKHITTDIAQLPYKSYKTFVFYNIMDTMVQYCIEYCTNDLEYVFGKCIMNNVRYSKVHRQTVYLMNRGIKEFESNGEGYIMGNNTNKFNEKPTEKFPGAFVADPQQLNDYSKMKIYGRAVDVYNNCVDFDYASLYPSVIRQMNIAPHTQIGMLIIANKVHDKENQHKLDNWTRASAFMEDIQSQVWIEFCSRWFHLADYALLYKEVIQFFTEVANSTNGLQEVNSLGLIDPLIPYKEGLVEEGIIFDNDGFREVNKEYITPNLEEMEAWRNAATANPNQQF